MAHAYTKFNSRQFSQPVRVKYTVIVFENIINLPNYRVYVFGMFGICQSGLIAMALRTTTSDAIIRAIY